MSKPNRLYFTFANQEHSLRVQPHRENDDLIVVKAHHPEALDNLAILTGVDFGIETKTKGSSYFLAFCDRKKFAQAVGVAVLFLAEPPPVAPADDDDDDGYDVC